MQEREACIIMNMLSGIGYIRYANLVNTFGSAAAALGQPVSVLERVKGIGPGLAASLHDWESHVALERELELAEKAGVRIYTLADDDYPSRLREIADPPLALYCRGRLPEDSGHAVAIVGSRRMSAYGARITRVMTEQAVMAGWTVISGLAFGVDAVAHEATLAANGVTVAVLGGGLMRITPQEHVPLAQRIVESGGAILSENSLEFPVNRQAFPRRNRLVAALTQATVVTEAGLDSGALITAKLALEQGRAVFAVPGRVDEPQARGCNALIREASAKLVESFQDVLDDFEFLPGLRPELAEHAEYRIADDGKRPPELVNDLERGVHGVLTEFGGGTLDKILAKLGGNPGEVMGTLMALEMRGVVRRAPDGSYTVL